jgi:hypothetical protein
MIINRVRQAFKEGRPSFGVYVMSPSPKMVEMMGFAGIDFIRFDLAEYPMDLETVHHMIRGACSRHFAIRANSARGRAAHRARASYGRIGHPNFTRSQPPMWKRLCARPKSRQSVTAMRVPAYSLLEWAR